MKCAKWSISSQGGPGRLCATLAGTGAEGGWGVASGMDMPVKASKAFQVKSAPSASVWSSQYRPAARSCSMRCAGAPRLRTGSCRRRVWSRATHDVPFSSMPAETTSPDPGDSPVDSPELPFGSMNHRRQVPSYSNPAASPSTLSSQAIPAGPVDPGASGVHVIEAMVVQRVKTDLMFAIFFARRSSHSQSKVIIFRTLNPAKFFFFVILLKPLTATSCFANTPLFLIHDHVFSDKMLKSF